MNLAAPLDRRAVQKSLLAMSETKDLPLLHGKKAKGDLFVVNRKLTGGVSPAPNLCPSKPLAQGGRKRGPHRSGQIQRAKGDHHAVFAGGGKR